MNNVYKLTKIMKELHEYLNILSNNSLLEIYSRILRECDLN